MQDMWDAFVETVERCIFKTEMPRLEAFTKSRQSFIGSIINKVQLRCPKEIFFSFWKARVIEIFKIGIAQVLKKIAISPDLTW